MQPAHYGIDPANLAFIPGQKKPGARSNLLRQGNDDCKMPRRQTNANKNTVLDPEAYPINNWTAVLILTIRSLQEFVDLGAIGKRHLDEFTDFVAKGVSDKQGLVSWLHIYEWMEEFISEFLQLAPKDLHQMSDEAEHSEFLREEWRATWKRLRNFNWELRTGEHDRTPWEMSLLAPPAPPPSSPTKPAQKGLARGSNKQAGSPAKKFGLCINFQHDRCKEEPCKNGKHLCERCLMEGREEKHCLREHNVKYVDKES